MAEVTREKDNVEELIKEIEERKIKCEESTISCQTKNIEIAKLMESVKVKEENAKVIMEQARIIKDDVEESVRNNLDDKKIKGMQAIMNNPPEKVKLIVQAVNCLSPTGQQQSNSWDGCKILLGKPQQLCDGIRGFMEESGNGKSLRMTHISNSETFIKDLFRKCKEEGVVSSMDEMPSYIKNKVSQEAFAL